jgi:hypothetical protein
VARLARAANQYQRGLTEAPSQRAEKSTPARPWQALINAQCKAILGNNMNKIAWSAAFLVFAGLATAHAQSDLSCADLIKANAQIDAATKAEMAKDATAAAMDKKINDYCAKNPTAKASEAMEKALQ